MTNSKYQQIVPEIPRVLSREQIQVYVPKATYDREGIAKFSNEDFDLSGDAVKIIRDNFDTDDFIINGKNVKIQRNNFAESFIIADNRALNGKSDAVKAQYQKLQDEYRVYVQQKNGTLRPKFVLTDFGEDYKDKQLPRHEDQSKNPGFILGSVPVRQGTYAKGYPFEGHIFTRRDLPYDGWDPYKEQSDMIVTPKKYVDDRDVATLEQAKDAMSDLSVRKTVVAPFSKCIHITKRAIRGDDKANPASTSIAFMNTNVDDFDRIYAEATLSCSYLSKEDVAAGITLGLHLYDVKHTSKSTYIAWTTLMGSEVAVNYGPVDNEGVSEHKFKVKVSDVYYNYNPLIEAPKFTIGLEWHSNGLVKVYLNNKLVEGLTSNKCTIDGVNLEDCVPYIAIAASQDVKCDLDIFAVNISASNSEAKLANYGYMDFDKLEVGAVSDWDFNSAIGVNLNPNRGDVWTVVEREYCSNSDTANRGFVIGKIDRRAVVQMPYMGDELAEKVLDEEFRYNRVYTRRSARDLDNDGDLDERTDYSRICMTESPMPPPRPDDYVANPSLYNDYKAKFPAKFARDYSGNITLGSIPVRTVDGDIRVPKRTFVNADSAAGGDGGDYAASVYGVREALKGKVDGITNTDSLPRLYGVRRKDSSANSGKGATYKLRWDPTSTDSAGDDTVEIPARKANGEMRCIVPDNPGNRTVANVKYVNDKIAELVNSAPQALDTLGEIAAALKENDSAIDTLLTNIGTKVEQDYLDYRLNEFYRDFTSNVMGQYASVYKISELIGLNNENVNRLLLASVGNKLSINLSSSNSSFQYPVPMHNSQIDYELYTLQFYIDSYGYAEIGVEVTGRDAYYGYTETVHITTLHLNGAPAEYSIAVSQVDAVVMRNGEYVERVSIDLGGANASLTFDLIPKTRSGDIDIIYARCDADVRVEVGEWPIDTKLSAEMSLNNRIVGSEAYNSTLGTSRWKVAAPSQYSVANVKYVNEQINSAVGDISSALDELHAYAQDLIGGN